MASGTHSYTIIELNLVYSDDTHPHNDIERHLASNQPVWQHLLAYLTASAMSPTISLSVATSSSQYSPVWWIEIAANQFSCIRTSERQNKVEKNKQENLIRN